MNPRRTSICILAGLLIAGLAVCPTGADAALYGAKSGSGWFVDMNRFGQGAHAAMTCESCHGGIQEHGRPHPDPEDPDFLASDAIQNFDYARCQPCHKVADKRYQTGGHAKAMEKQARGELPLVDEEGKPKAPAPTCGHCHTAHYDRSHLSRVEIGRQMMDRCDSCHPEYVASYLENNHGRAAVNLGNEKSAFCTDCHGAHSTDALKDADKRLASCQRCHPEAGAQFADVVIHLGHDALEKEDAFKQERVRRIGLVSIVSLVFVVAVLAFFYTHTFLLTLRKIHDKLRKHE